MITWAGISMAFALGLWTSISPCPLAGNLAAMTFLARRLDSQAAVLLSGLLYTLGRVLAYVVVAVAILYFLLEAASVSFYLDRYFNTALGPVLILTGMLLLGLLQPTASLSLAGQGLQQRAARGGVWWSLPMGALFALSFCPISAALFFLSLIGLAGREHSLLVLPALYGVGTALPVVGFAMLAAFASQHVGKAFNRLAQLERAVRVIAGAAFILAGFYYCLVYIYGLPLNAA